MKLLRPFLFLLLIASVSALFWVLMTEQPKSPFSQSFAPLFQELGKPLKSFDRAVSQLLFIHDEDEKKLGEELKTKLSSMPSAGEEETVRYLNALITSLTAEKAKDFDYQVFLVEGSPNAFAMPGGVLCITKGMLDILENEAELAAILGHEIGHVERSHLFDALRGEMLSRKMGKPTGSVSFADLLHRMLSFSYSKTQEDEADEYAFRLLVKMGYDPYALSRSFQRLSEATHHVHSSGHLITDFFSSHPCTEHRIEKFHSKAKLWEERHLIKDLYIGKKNFEDRITFFETQFADEWKTF